MSQATSPERDPRTITRPDPALHTYYLITSLFFLPLFPLVYLPNLFKYRTLRYRFDDEGVSMSWGRFFQRETYLTYRRIQDIQMTRGVIQRRLGLATLELQTASGGVGAEMRIEGIRNPEQLRDFLYERMEGDSGAPASPGEPAPGSARPSGSGGAEARAGSGPAEASGATGSDRGAHPDEALQLLLEIRDELRRLNASGGRE